MKTRPLLVSVCSLALLGLTGCAPGFFAWTPPTSPSAPVSSEPAASETSEPTTPATSAAAAEAVDLTFAEGVSVDPAAVAEWGDAFALNDAYELTYPDDGNGSWGYTETATGCVVLFYQGAVGGIDYTAGDEAASDELLVTLMDLDASSVAEHVDTVQIPRAPSGGIVDARGLYVETTSGSMLIATRAFGALEVGLMVQDACPTSTDAAKHFAALQSSLAIIVS